jgi:V8-like Glu-specific endopeptidase
MGMDKSRIIQLVKYIGITFYFIFAISCGEKRDEEPARPQTQVEETRSEATELKYSLKNEIDKFHANCMEEEGCLDGVGMIVASEKEGYAYRCSGFLIDKDTVATSGHCLPKDLREKTSNCEGRLYLVLPNSDSQKEETLECSKITSFKQEQGSLYDYAFFKIKTPSKRSPLKINQKDRVNLESTTIWKSNPHNKFDGRIYKTNCHLQQDAINSEFFDGPKTGVINFSGCLTRKGNSGSPVLNNTSEVIGIHQSSLKSTSDMGVILKKYVRNRNFHASGTATNFGCLCKLGDGYTDQCIQTPQSCDVKYTNLELDSRRNKFLNTSMLKNLTKAERSWVRNATSAGISFPFEWKTTSSFRVVYNKVSKLPEDLNIYVSGTPKCIQSRVDVIEESINIDIHDYNFDRSLFVSMARLCKVKFKFSKTLQFESMKLNLDDCRVGRGYIDYKSTEITNEQLPLIFSYAATSYKDIGTPFPQGLKLRYCR